MEINHLQIFADAAQTLNFSETAQRLHTSQPTVSKHIKELEGELGIELFERVSGGKIKLSQQGRALLPWAQQLLRECNRFHQLAHTLNDRVTGALSIACATSSGKYLLPLLAARFRQRFPEVQLRLIPCPPRQITANLLDKEIDLGIVSFENITEGLACQQFFLDEVILIVPAKHPWVRRRIIDPDDLLAEPILLREPESATRRALASALAAHDISISDLNVLLELGNAEGIINTVSTGIGVAFVSRVTAGTAMRAGIVCEVQVNGVHIERKICMLRNSLVPLTRPAELFWDFVHDPENADILK